MLASITADAKIPPLSPEQLERGADLIIEGTVHAVEADGEVTHDHCYGWQKYKARVIVKKILKGGPTPKIVVVAYSTRVIDENKCVGGRDSYLLVEGERYRMYLSKPKGGKYYYFFNWTCLQSLPGRGPAMTNPYKLAQAALNAYRRKDLKAYNALLKAPFAKIPSMVVFEHAALLSKRDKVLGLYFTDDKQKRIAAVVRKAAGKKPAIWFEIERVKNGFSIITLTVSSKNPPMKISVEGF
jgi:hypothetical protein